MSYENYKVNIPEGSKGDWAVSKFVVPEHSIEGIRLSMAGRYCPPGSYPKLTRKGSVIMSDTPSEIRDFIGFVYKAHGACLINGLGLGVVLKSIMNKPEVTHVDVVELEQDVIDLIAPSFSQYTNLTIHHANAYEIQWAKGKNWDCGWHDIWDNICTDNLEGSAKLKRKYARRVKYQSAWVEDILRYNKRREKVYSYA